MKALLLILSVSWISAQSLASDVTELATGKRFEVSSDAKFLIFEQGEQKEGITLYSLPVSGGSPRDLSGDLPAPLSAWTILDRQAAVLMITNKVAESAARLWIKDLSGSEPLRLLATLPDVPDHLWLANHIWDIHRETQQFFSIQVAKRVDDFIFVLTSVDLVTGKITYSDRRTHEEWHYNEDWERINGSIRLWNETGLGVTFVAGGNSFYLSPDDRSLVKGCSSSVIGSEYLTPDEFPTVGNYAFIFCSDGSVQGFDYSAAERKPFEVLPSGGNRSDFQFYGVPTGVPRLLYQERENDSGYGFYRSHLYMMTIDGTSKVELAEINLKHVWAESNYPHATASNRVGTSDEILMHLPERLVQVDLLNGEQRMLAYLPSRLDGGYVFDNGNLLLSRIPEPEDQFESLTSELHFLNWQPGMQEGKLLQKLDENGWEYSSRYWYTGFHRLGDGRAVLMTRSNISSPRRAQMLGVFSDHGELLAPAFCEDHTCQFEVLGDRVFWQKDGSIFTWKAPWHFASP